MSGGYFNGYEFIIGELAEEIERLIKNNDEPNKWGTELSVEPKTIEKFIECVDLLKKAKIYVNRIDYLISGDDGEETFHKRLKDDLKIIKGR